MSSQYHIHMLVTGKINNTKILPEELCEWFSNLVKMVNMEEFHAPIAKYDTTEGNEGVTGIVLITTSHSSVHIWEENGLIQFDLYSCKDFDIDPVISEIDRMFDYEFLNTMMIDRNNFTNKIISTLFYEK